VTGRAAIAALYDAHPPSSPMRVVASSVTQANLATGRFVWVAAPDTGGEFILHLRGGRLARLEVRLDAPPPPPLPPRGR
jgi:hypothetical protein